jgi:hypothetical protein
LREFTARFASPEEVANWDSHVTANPNGGNLLQSEAFADVKRHFGWKPLHLVYETADYVSYNLVLEKSFPVLGKLWYLIKIFRASPKPTRISSSEPGSTSSPSRSSLTSC